MDLVLRKDGKEDQSKHPFFKTNVHEGYTEYELSFTVNEVGLYFYRFEIRKGDNLYFRGKDQSCDLALIADWLPEWQLTIYENQFATPTWFSQGSYIKSLLIGFLKAAHLTWQT